MQLLIYHRVSDEEVFRCIPALISSENSASALSPADWM